MQTARSSINEIISCLSGANLTTARFVLRVILLLEESTLRFAHRPCWFDAQRSHLSGYPYLHCTDIKLGAAVAFDLKSN